MTTKGLVLREQKKIDKELVEAEKAIAIDPNYANAHVLYYIMPVNPERDWKADHAPRG